MNTAQCKCREPLVSRFPQAVTDQLVARGWVYADSNESYVFFEKPGYWLRIFYYADHWAATVMPEHFRILHKQAESRFERYEEDELPPSFTGKGAKARALAHAQALWGEHAPFLEGLGVQLESVGVLQNCASGGAGSQLGTKCYRRHDVEQVSA